MLRVMGTMSQLLALLGLLPALLVLPTAYSQPDQMPLSGNVYAHPMDPRAEQCICKHSL